MEWGWSRRFEMMEILEAWPLNHEVWSVIDFVGKIYGERGGVRGADGWREGGRKRCVDLGFW